MRRLPVLGGALALGFIGLLIWATQPPAGTPRSSASGRTFRSGPCAQDQGLGQVIPGPAICAPRASAAQPWSVSASGPNDVWAVGYRTTVKSMTFHSLAMHFDGTRWKSLPVPNVGIIQDVSADSPTDAWAVGRSILHWDGS